MPTLVRTAVKNDRHCLAHTTVERRGVFDRLPADVADILIQLLGSIAGLLDDRATQPFVPLNAHMDRNVNCNQMIVQMQ